MQGYAQKYYTADVRAKADSILRLYLGDSVFYKYARYDTDTYYEYINVLGKTSWETLSTFKKTKGKFVEVDMRWNLLIPYPKCPAYDTIKGKTFFVLNDSLSPIDKPYFDFIPDFYWSKDSCHIIDRTQAMAVAEKQPLCSSPYPLQATLLYDKKNLFHWEISHILWQRKDDLNNDYGDIEILSIDAQTGTVKWLATNRFAPVY